MKEELEHKLFKRFPLLFRGRHLSLKQNLMAFGIETGDGWYDIIYLACLGVEEENNKLFYGWYLKLFILLNIAANYWNRLMWKAPLFMQREYIWGHAARFLIELPQVPVFSQIKEKFGTLRMYLSVSTDKQQDYVTAAEKASHVVCEQCGRYGVMRGKHWFYVACDDHAKPADIEPWEMDL